MQLAEATSSLARAAVAFIRAGFVMEMMIVKTMKMKEDVVNTIANFQWYFQSKMTLTYIYEILTSQDVLNKFNFF